MLSSLKNHTCKRRISRREIFRFYNHCSRFRFRSSSRSSSSCSSSLSAVSAGFRICAMLPLRVGGPELSFSSPDGVLSLSRGPPQDQLFRCSGVLPFVKGGVVGRELSVRLWDAVVREYELKLSRMRWSSFMVFSARLGDDGHGDDDWPEAKGDGFACQPCTLRISAEV